MTDLAPRVVEPGEYDPVRQMRMMPDGMPAVFRSGDEKTYTFVEKDSSDPAGPSMKTIPEVELQLDVAERQPYWGEATVTKAQKDPGDPTAWAETTLTESPGRDPGDPTTWAETTNTRGGKDPGDPGIWAETTGTKEPGKDPGDPASPTSDMLGRSLTWMDESYGDDLATGVVAF